MKKWFYELLIVLALSKRTQLSIVIGIIGFFVINLWGNHHAQNIEFSGQMSAFEKAFKELILHRYDKLALGCLISFWLLAIKLFHKDKKRFHKSLYS